MIDINNKNKQSLNERKFIRCRRCNRILTNNEARIRGYGQHCWKLHLLECENINSLFPIKGG